MKATQPLPPTEKTTCYHCGDFCIENNVSYDQHSFCCDGCKLVYELLKENDLCNYYDISKAPGHSAEQEHRRAIYDSLDESGVREKIILFEDTNISRVKFHVPIMHCSSCIWLLENLHKIKPEIISSTVNFPRREVTIDFEKGKIKLSEVAALMSATGYAPSISLGDLEIKEKKKRFNSRVLKIGIAGFCFGNIMMLSFPEYLSIGDLKEVPQLRSFFAWLSLGLSLPVLLYCASDFFISAWKAIRFRSLNIDAPIALAVGVTFLRSAVEIISGTGTSYLDSMSGIVFFMLIGRYFQDRTYENLSFERDYKSYFPIAVTVIRNGKEESVAVTKLKAGNKIIIRSGELIPTDAILISETANVDYSFVTGEANPVRKLKGEKIFAGARQTDGAIELEVLKETSQSYLTQLWNNDTFSRRGEAQRKTYIDNINRWFTSGVLLVSFGSAIIWYFIDPRLSLNVMTAVLIVACPCTLLLASTFTNGNVLRWLGRSGFYLKNAGVIERIATSNTIVFDKTGTITNGSVAQIKFEGDPLTSEERSAVMSLASQSGHPLSRRIASSFSNEETVSQIKQIREIQGKGLSGIIDGDEYLLGSRDFTGGTSVGKNGGTEVWLAINGKIRGRFLFHNSYREGFVSLSENLKKNYQIELLSGDNDAEMEKLRPVFGDGMKFAQSPQMKLDHIQALQNSGRKVLMVGDGLNDAGALMQSDAGIAVSDNMNNFFPACDAILDGTNFEQLPQLLSFARVARKVVIVTFFISAMYNLVGIFFSVRGELSPLIAAILMPASSFSVIAITTISVRFAALRLKKT
ncbi:MAG: heavy metal translocating P-type ATPase metal-binding domain-containing protein [Bacteroidetes bacterium]|nr:heavy metal translocating P-type ATPase metal-binding domain-containing protein [Bacteroidota bacterium]